MPSKGTTTQRGYGTTHQKIRKHWELVVQSGKAHCARCGQPLPPDAKWDLGHDDHDRRRYTGPEHIGRECPEGGNRATKGRQKTKPTTDTSRQW